MTICRLDVNMMYLILCLLIGLSAKGCFCEYSDEDVSSSSSNARSSRHLTDYGYAYNPPPTQPTPIAHFSPIDSPSCKQCKPAHHCKSELEIRDSDIPKEVPIPSIDYQIVYKDKPIQVVTDFDIRENPRPVPVQLQDQQVVLEPNQRTVEKVVVVRVPRITENVVVKKLDRIKLVTEVRSKPKLVKIQHVRQVPDPVKIPLLKDVVKKRLVPETEFVPVPVRIANEVEVDIQRVDKPVSLPSIQYRYCEHIQEIKIKGDCPQPTSTPTYLPPETYVVGHHRTGAENTRDTIARPGNDYVVGHHKRN